MFFCRFEKKASVISIFSCRSLHFRTMEEEQKSERVSRVVQDLVGSRLQFAFPIRVVLFLIAIRSEYNVLTESVHFFQFPKHYSAFLQDI